MQPSDLQCPPNPKTDRRPPVLRTSEPQLLHGPRANRIAIDPCEVFLTNEPGSSMVGSLFESSDRLWYAQGPGNP